VAGQVQGLQGGQVRGSAKRDQDVVMYGVMHVLAMRSSLKCSKRGGGAREGAGGYPKPEWWCNPSELYCRYCSLECQDRDWKVHRPYCRSVGGTRQ
jgi:hypothetical protein